MTGLKEDARMRARAIVEQAIEYRRESGLTVTGVAIKMGVSPNTVRILEASHSDPKITLLLLYLAACGNDYAIDFVERTRRQTEQQFMDRTNHE